MMTNFFRSYRGRLIVYSISLILFLTTITVYSYYYVLSIIKHESDEHITRVAQISNTRLQDMRSTLKGYTEIVSSDLRLQEYLYVVTIIGSDSKPLHELYQRHFGWLNTDRRMLITSKGKMILGEQDAVFRKAIEPYIKQQKQVTAYIPAEDGLELIAISPIRYRDSLLGSIIFSKRLGHKWLESQHNDTGILAFFEKQGEIIASCSDHLLNTPTFENEGKRLWAGGESYQTLQLNIAGVNKNMPQLWFAIKDTELTARLDQHRRTVMMLVGIGILAISVFGFLLIRNFSRPLSQLMTMTREIAAGNLPQLEKTSVHNEVEALSNQFADMVKALRDKQDEIEQVHSALKKSAITDMLTGLYNRRYLQVVFPKLVAQAQRDQHHVAALLIDIDKFKRINDTYGHIGGDLCLAHFSDVLRQHSRTNDYLFRIGGEEFLILTIAEDVDGTVNFAEKLRHAIETSPTSHNNELINFTISSGISFADPKSDASEVLTRMMGKADRALYQAKENGRNQVQIDQDSLDMFLQLSQRFSSL